LLGKVSNPLEADLLVRRAVDQLGIREELLRRPLILSRSKQPTNRFVDGFTASGPPARDDVAEQSLVSLMLRFPSVVGEFQRLKGSPNWIGPAWRDVVDLIVSEWQEQGSVDVGRIEQKLPPDRASEIAGLALREDKLSETQCIQMAADCLAHLQRKYLKRLERNLRVAIRTAEEQNDEKAKRERILEWQEVVREERRLDRPKLEAKTITR
jgi:hypothetical protein